MGAIPSEVLAEAQKKRAAKNAQDAGIEIVAEDPAASALQAKTEQYCVSMQILQSPPKIEHTWAQR